MSTRRMNFTSGLFSAYLMKSCNAAACADVTLMELRAGPVHLTDASEKGRETVTAERALMPAGVVRAGNVICYRPL